MAGRQAVFGKKRNTPGARSCFKRTFIAVGHQWVFGHFAGVFRTDQIGREWHVISIVFPELSNRDNVANSTMKPCKLWSAMFVFNASRLRERYRNTLRFVFILYVLKTIF